MSEENVNVPRIKSSLTLISNLINPNWFTVEEITIGYSGVIFGSFC